jgi:hypothetical protein
MSKDSAAQTPLYKFGCDLTAAVSDIENFAGEIHRAFALVVACLVAMSDCASHHTVSTGSALLPNAA